MKCLKIFIVATGRIRRVFQIQNGNGTREKYSEKKKENEKDVKKRYNKQYS